MESLRPIFETLAPAPDKGWGRVGPVGAGHFVKMIHNGIEYGLMQAYAEGFEIMHAKKDFELDLEQVAQIWRYGSVVRSWLLDLTADALAKDQDLAASRAGWRIAARAAGRWLRRSTWMCPLRSSPFRCSSVSSAARPKVMPPNCWPPCAMSSAVTL